MNAYQMDTNSSLAPSLACASALSRMEVEVLWVLEGEVVQCGHEIVSRLKAAYADAA